MIETCPVEFCGKEGREGPCPLGPGQCRYPYNVRDIGKRIGTGPCPMGEKGIKGVAGRCDRGIIFIPALLLLAGAFLVVLLLVS